MRRALLGLLLGGCIDPQANLNEVLPAYQGRPVDDMKMRWGPPEQVLNRDDGSTVYTWASKSTYTFSDQGVSTGMIGNTPVVMTVPTSSGQQLSCRAMVRVATGVVTGMRLVGAAGECDKMLNQLR